MPKSKHRRKPGGKAVAHPGRSKPGKPLRARLDELDATPQGPDTSGLPLFDWAEKGPGAPNMHPVDTEDAEWWVTDPMTFRP